MSDPREGRRGPLRTVLLACLTLLILGGIFAGYWLAQSGPHRDTVATTPVAPPSTEPAVSMPRAGQQLGPGEQGWVSTYDANRKLVSQFRADHYLPQPDGTINVVHPEARVAMSGGQTMHMTAVDGVVETSNSPAGGKGGDSLMGGSPMTPTRGHFHAVTVQLLPPGGGDPIATMTTNNVTFDNDTYQLYTDSFTDPVSGQIVPHDQVPVQVRGQQFDMDGKGLTLRWDDVDHQLSLLDIDHGDQITLKQTAPAEGGGIASAQAAASTAPSIQPLAPSRQPAIATTVPAAAPAPASAAAPATPAAGPTTDRASVDVTYRATLLRDVTITQGGITLGAGDKLLVDFLMAASRPAAATAPAATHPADAAGRGRRAISPTLPPPAAPAVTTPAGPPPTVPMPAPAPTPKAAESSATRKDIATPSNATESQAPVIVRWTGRLRIIPLGGSTSPLMPLAHGQQAAELSGRPATLTKDGSVVTCGSAVYRTDGSVHAAGRDPTPIVTFTDAAGRVVKTPAMDFDAEQNIATLLGPGSLHAPAAAPITAPMPPAAARASTQPADMLDATWLDRCVVHLHGVGNQRVIERADLFGNVHVSHPKLDLTSQTLSLRFAPGTDANKPVLRQVLAGGDVTCAAPGDTPADARHLTCRNLALEMGATAAGSLFPRQFDAAGDVHAWQGGQQLWAQQATARFHPLSRIATVVEMTDAPPALALDRFDAAGDVRLANADGSTASGDRLHIEPDPAAALAEAAREQAATQRVPHGSPPLAISLLGAAGRPAHAAGNGGTLEGWEIDLASTGRRAHVNGPGTMHVIRTEAGDKPAVITWTNAADLDAALNTVDVHGDVQLTAGQTNGASDHTRSNDVHIDLVDTAANTMNSPATARSAPPARAAAPSTSQPAARLAGKQAKLVVLLGDVQVDALDPPLPAAAGAIVQPAKESHLLCQRLEYVPATGHVLVPGAGRILYVDRQAGSSTTHPAKASSDAGGPGSTGIGWSRQMVYDKQAGVVVVDGDVIAKRQPDDPTQQRMELRASSLRGELASAPATTQPLAPTGGSLKHVTAYGPVTFAAKGVSFAASQVDFDPTTNIMTAAGAGTTPGQVLDNTGAATATFDRLLYDVKAAKILRTEGFTSSIRQLDTPKPAGR